MTGFWRDLILQLSPIHHECASRDEFTLLETRMLDIDSLAVLPEPSRLSAGFTLGPRASFLPYLTANHRIFPFMHRRHLAFDSQRLQFVSVCHLRIVMSLYRCKRLWAASLALPGRYIRGRC